MYDQNGISLRKCNFRIIAALVCLLLTAQLLLPAAALAANTGVTNDKVVLRSKASKGSAILQSLPKGEEVIILGSSGSWYRVRYGQYTGYMMKQYINADNSNASSNSSSGTSASSAEKIKALGTPPGAMRIGDENSDVKKLQQALEILGYYDGRIDGDYGRGTTAAVKAYQKAHKLTTDGIAGRGTVKSIFGSCASTSMNPALNSSSDSSSSTSSSANTVSSISEIGSAPSPTKKGSRGKDVIKLQQALECLGYYSGDIDGDYGAKTVAAVKRFQEKRGLKADGIAGNGTIRVLFGSSASGSSSSGSQSSKKYKTETLSWFKDNVTNVIPKGARFTIKDVLTGKKFEAVRWAGYNHIDAEPRTSSDTKIMKAIYGGSWSWRRRPILILYNGHVYAASMNGMPHGTSTISSNNFAGHFCIHFKDSKTHETNRVDGDHQDAVNKASRYSW